MTREEEIKQTAKNRADQYEHPVDWNNCYHHYIQGAEWADQHPREGLWDAQKVCDFLKNKCVFSAANSSVIVEFNGEELVRKLRKAMEE